MVTRAGHFLSFQWLGTFLHFEEVVLMFAKGGFIVSLTCIRCWQQACQSVTRQVKFLVLTMILSMHLCCCCARTEGLFTSTTRSSKRRSKQFKGCWSSSVSFTDFMEDDNEPLQYWTRQLLLHCTGLMSPHCTFRSNLLINGLHCLFGWALIEQWLTVFSFSNRVEVEERRIEIYHKKYSIDFSLILSFGLNQNCRQM